MAGTAADGARGRVLVIEPNAAIGRLLARALAQEGYAVATARDAATGADRARAWRAALVVMDLRGGAEALARAAEVSGAAGAPVLAMASHGDTIAAFADAGRPLLRKPFALSELLEGVAAALRAAPPAPLRQLLAALSWSSGSIL